MTTPLHPQAPDGRWHYAITYQWFGDGGQGGIEQSYFHTERPLNSVSSMEHALAAIRSRHPSSRSVVLLCLFPLEQGLGEQGYPERTAPPQAPHSPLN